MNYLAMLKALPKKDRGQLRQLSTDFKYTGLKEYPRPQMERSSYINLNGKWDYRIIDGQGQVASSGQIVVPFSPETLLSGTDMHVLRPEETLEYTRIIKVDRLRTGKRLMLNFGAVDQVAYVFINGQSVGSHEGGYTAFTMDITDYVTEGENTLVVKVRDYMDTVGYARGKQSLTPGGMWYQGQSGIWQTVWMEWVPDIYIRSLLITPDIDNNRLRIRLDVPEAKGQVEVLSEDAKLIKEYRVVAVDEEELQIEVRLGPTKLWTPDNPVLYNLTINYGKDSVKTYFAMRVFGVAKDKRGIPRLTLNHEPMFFNGVLDQGYYPESLMTPPSDEAMIYDITTMKELGFNMLRKHAKVEPMRWYYHCDRLGMVVWQDIVNGGTAYNMNMICNLPTAVRPFGKTEDKNRLFMKFTGRNTPESKSVWYKEASEIVNQLANVPSIGQWVIFNEGWGQFNAAYCTKYIRGLDRTRPVDSASGWFHENCGDVYSEHYYFEPLHIVKTEWPFVISEYGGYTRRVEDHYYSDAVYGYKHFEDEQGLQVEFDNTMDLVELLIEDGLCGAVYTQLSDVEDELNGLLTYDRKLTKIQKRRTITDESDGD